MKKAIIVDLDGTLCMFDRENKSPYERDFENDQVNEAIKTLIQLWELNSSNHILFCSGRNDKNRKTTEDWLHKHFPFFFTSKQFHLFMRKDGDTRKDVILKQEIYNTEIKDKYDILCAFDDRDQVVAFWRSLGITCFQVDFGDF